MSEMWSSLGLSSKMAETVALCVAWVRMERGVFGGRTPMIEWMVTVWLVVGPAAGPMTYGFTDQAPCSTWREELLRSRVPLLVGECERATEKDYRRRVIGQVPNPYGLTKAS